jgi:hypothetical protein
MFAQYEKDVRRAFSPAQIETSPQAAVDLQPIGVAFREGTRLNLESKWAEAAKKLELCVEVYEKELGEDDLERMSAKRPTRCVLC